MKPYNDLTDMEKGWIREYKSWCMCGRNNPDLIELALTMAEQYRTFLRHHNLDVNNYI